MFAFPLYSQPYPQRLDWQQAPKLDRLWRRWLNIPCRRRQVSPRRLRLFSAQVLQYDRQLQGQSDAERVQALLRLRHQLRRQGFRPALAAQVFAHVRQQTGRELGLWHFPTQLQGGYLLLQGYLGEMDTGEGKTLTAALAAATVALAGLAVHVVTVNDYLAQRDVEQLGPIYRFLGLSVAVVLEGMSLEEKRIAYQADIVYCCNKVLVFDYLRDRLTMQQRSHSLALSMQQLIADPQSPLLLRGLQYAIVDEADSIFIDEARTPLILSRGIHDQALQNYYRQAMTMALALARDEDFAISRDGQQIRLYEHGMQRLAALAEEGSALLQAQNRRREIVIQALTALYVFQRDVHYIVRDDKVLLVDENTGRIMPDRSWEHGLQQLVEIKEGVAISPEKETLGKISYQLFFRRYLRLSGMSGTVKEVADEVRDVYDIDVVRVEPYRPSRRQRFPTRIYASAERRWQAVIDSVIMLRQQGRSILIGTRSIAASEQLSDLLWAAGIEHQVLNAKQDASEAAIIAAAGDRGRITIATNMAGRGTDIRLTDSCHAAGGLHVIVTERHDNARVDRQLAGRCARQGDPGSWQCLLSLDDELVRAFLPAVNRWLRYRLSAAGQHRFWQWLANGYYLLAQKRIQFQHGKMRQRLLQNDFKTRHALSFTGEME